VWRDLADLSMANDGSRTSAWKNNLRFAFSSWHSFMVRTKTSRSPLTESDSACFWAGVPFCLFGGILLLAETETLRIFAGGERCVFEPIRYDVTHFFFFSLQRTVRRDRSRLRLCRSRAILTPTFVRRGCRSPDFGFTGAITRTAQAFRLGVDPRWSDCRVDGGGACVWLCQWRPSAFACSPPDLALSSFSQVLHQIFTWSAENQFSLAPSTTPWVCYIAISESLTEPLLLLVFAIASNNLAPFSNRLDLWPPARRSC
jgi:hypothetical protein